MEDVQFDFQSFKLPWKSVQIDHDQFDAKNEYHV